MKHTVNYLPSTHSLLISSLLSEPWICQFPLLPRHLCNSREEDPFLELDLFGPHNPIPFASDRFKNWHLLANDM